MRFRTDANRLFPTLMQAFLIAAPLFALAGNAISDIWLCILVAALLIHSAWRRDLSWAQHPWFVAALLFWIWALLCAGLSRAPVASLLIALPWLRFPLGAAAIGYFLADAKRSRGLYPIMLTATVLLIAILAGERFLHPDASRLHGIWHGSKEGWYLLGIGLPAALWALECSGRTGRHRVPAILFAAGLLASTVSTGEIYSSASVLLGLMVYTLLARDGSRRLLFGAIVAALLIASLLAAYPALLERYSSMGIERLPWRASSDYYVAWHDAWRLGLRHPVTGVGPGQSFHSCAELGPHAPGPYGITTCLSHPHQLYLQAFAETGMTGLVLLVALVVALWLDAATDAAERWRWRERALAIAIVTTAFWPIATYSDAFEQHKNFFTWFMAGLALAIARQPQPSFPERRSVPE